MPKNIWHSLLQGLIISAPSPCRSRKKFWTLNVPPPGNKWLVFKIEFTVIKKLDLDLYKAWITENFYYFFCFVYLLEF